MRNWIIGYYIVEYEQHGDDKAEYGEQLFKKRAERLKNAEINGFPLLLYTYVNNFTLHTYKLFRQVSEHFQNINIQSIRILRQCLKYLKKYDIHKQIYR